MAAQGTLTHVLEVAAQLQAADAKHAASIAEAAAAAASAIPQPPPADPPTMGY